MTVIAWDGVTLAADRLAVSGNTKREICKVRKLSGRLVGISGGNANGAAIVEWLNCGTQFPELSGNEDDWASVCVIYESGQIHVYENSQFPIVFPPQKMAFGSGRDFATAAMHLGLSAVKAVEVACLFDRSCGVGVDAISFGGEGQ